MVFCSISVIFYDLTWSFIQNCFCHEHLFKRLPLTILILNVSATPENPLTLCWQTVLSPWLLLLWWIQAFALYKYPMDMVFINEYLIFIGTGDVHCRLKSVSFQAHENHISHETQGLSKKHLVVRRGKPFKVTLMFDSSWNPQTESLVLEVRLGNKPGNKLFYITHWLTLRKR